MVSLQYKNMSKSDSDCVVATTWRFWCVAASLIFALGCTGNDGASSSGKAYLLPTKPAAEPLGVVALKTAIQAGTVGSGDATIIGRVGGGQNETWTPGSATFLIRDLALKIQSHDHDGNHDNCKFCQAEKAKELESMALIQLVDANGEPVAADARELLGVEDEQIVIAQGTGAVDQAGFVFTAKKIFVDDTAGEAAVAH
jgi:hypothetical protein